MEAYALDPHITRDISSIMLDDRGTLKVLPSSVLATTTREERLLFGVLHGLYGFPTDELCEFLRDRIGGRSAIEIGAGHGVLAAKLGIPATDNRQQDDPAIRRHYDRLGQPTVPYGDNVEKLDAAEAVRRYKPSVVVASWVTHRFNPRLPQLGGNESGVDEAAIIQACDEYIFIGNERVHALKPIWGLPHEKISPPWVYSRAMNGHPDFVAIWRRDAL